MQMRYPGCTGAFWGAPGLGGGGRPWVGGEEAAVTRGSEEAAEKARSEGGLRSPARKTQHGSAGHRAFLEQLSSRARWTSAGQEMQDPRG